MTISETLDEQFNLIKIDLIEEHDRLNMRASGKSAESLEVITKGNTTTLLGNSNWEQLEFGRSPTGSGGGSGTPLIERITEWIKDKGIINNIEGGISLSSLAFLITRKIHKLGWDRKDHGGLEVITNVITEKRIQGIIDLVGEESAINLVTIIQNELKIIA